MDKASDYESEDSSFKSWQDRALSSLALVTQLKLLTTGLGFPDAEEWVGGEIKSCLCLPDRELKPGLPRDRQGY